MKMHNHNHSLQATPLARLVAAGDCGNGGGLLMFLGSFVTRGAPELGAVGLIKPSRKGLKFHTGAHCDTNSELG